MRERPRVSEATLRSAVREHYGVHPRRFTFLPLGADSATWAYRMEVADGTVYFLKLRGRQGFGPASLAVPHYLTARGLPHVLGPVPTRSGSLWVDLGEFALTLYPFVAGRTGAEAGLAEAHWRALGALMRRVHDLAPPPDLLAVLPRERLVPAGRHLVPLLEERVGRLAAGDALEREFAQVWSAHAAEVAAVVARSDALAAHLSGTAAPMVLCHGDMHPWNLLLDGRDGLWLVDWDGTVLARRERDLMFVVGGIGGDGVGADQAAWFLSGYGDVAVDPVALAYYRCAWAVQDIAGFGADVVLRPDLGEVSRRAALRWFKGLFSPGAIVRKALDTDVGGDPK